MISKKIGTYLEREYDLWTTQARCPYCEKMNRFLYDKENKRTHRKNCCEHFLRIESPSTNKHILEICFATET